MTRKTLDVYVGMDDRERCLWGGLTEIGVHGTGRPIEVWCAWLCTTKRGPCDDQARGVQ
jgi:hypothetical protein